RRRYFACSPDAGKILERGGCPNVLGRYLLTFLEQLGQGQGCYYDFLAGPGAWALARLGQCDRVLVWLADFPGRPWWSAEELARTAGHLQAPLPFPSLLPGAGTSSRPRAFLVPTQGEAFAELFVACALMASWDSRDCFIASASGEQVVLLHHHDKVIVSIPDRTSRPQTLRDLRNNPDLFEDVSGYG